MNDNLLPIQMANDMMVFGFEAGLALLKWHKHW